ncbi:MAG: hypothetical protein JJU29_11990 [Verrucomicrobia bacterium]|nr:hypothetical protein [Verrucomicrobiota bacterium]MCH8513094.1 DUF4380 domain-containing protein [Kiritimatiellia bacterium]
MKWICTVFLWMQCFSFRVGAGEAVWHEVLTLSNENVRVQVAPEIGRIVYLSTGEGPNLLRQDKTLVGTTQVPPGRWAWNNYGGDWLWPVPQDHWEALGVDRRWPPPSEFEPVAWSAEIRQDAEGREEIHMRLDVGEPLNIRVSRILKLSDDRPGVLIVEQSLIRQAPSDIVVCLWQIAQMDTPRQVRLERPENSRHEQGWRRIQGPEPEEGALQVLDGEVQLEVEKAKRAKLGTDGLWIEGTNAGGTLRILVENGNEPGELPDGGCSLAVAIGREGDYAELESMSVERNLRVGERLANRLLYILE